MNQFTVTTVLQDGYTIVRELLDQKELNKYISSGIAMHLVLTITIMNNFES